MSTKTYSAQTRQAPTEREQRSSTTSSADEAGERNVLAATRPKQMRFGIYTPPPPGDMLRSNRGREQRRSTSVWHRFTVGISGVAIRARKARQELRCTFCAHEESDMTALSLKMMVVVLQDESSNATRMRRLIGLRLRRLPEEVLSGFRMPHVATTLLQLRSSLCEQAG